MPFACQMRLSIIDNRWFQPSNSNSSFSCYRTQGARESSKNKMSFWWCKFWRPKPLSIFAAEDFGPHTWKKFLPLLFLLTVCLEWEKNEKYSRLFYNCCHGKMLIENSLFVFYWIAVYIGNQLAWVFHHNKTLFVCAVT